MSKLCEKSVHLGLEHATIEFAIVIKLLSPSNKVQTKTQVKRTIPSPEISYLCQLSQSQEHTQARVERMHSISDSIDKR